MRWFLYSMFLLALSACTAGTDCGRMRMGLDSLNQCNRGDQPFSVADVEPYVQYFDRHGTANDRLLAHYLSGRAYHEAGEAPMALQCYQKAIDSADTLSASCDYAQLSRVYAQMEALFYQQDLYKEQLLYADKAVKYAWMAHDTLTALIEEEQKSNAYAGMYQPDSAIAISERVAALYGQYGYPADAAITLGGISYQVLKKGDRAKARQYIEMYEAQSGFFDEKMQIEDGREMYYFYKGMLLLHEERLDSAAYFFKRLLREGHTYNDYNAAAQGLASLFEKKQCPDSALKYYQLAFSVSDSMFCEARTSEIEKLQAAYNYSRHQRIAHRAELKAEQERRSQIWIMTVSACLLLSLYLIILYMRQKRRAEHSKYLESLKTIEQAQTDIITLRTQETAFQELIVQKEELIERQKAQLHQYQQAKLTSDLASAESRLMKSREYQQLHLIATKGLQPSEEEWRMIRRLVIEVFPGFNEFLTSKEYALNMNEYNVCILIRLHVKPTSICNMLGKSKSAITKIRIRLLQKMFGVDGSSQEFDERILKMC